MNEDESTRDAGRPTMWQRAQNKLRYESKSVARGFNAFAHRMYVDARPDWRSSIFIAGAGRSGTTWLSDVINFKNDYRYMYEPFHPDEVPEAKMFRLWQYLRPDDDNPTYVEPARAMLSGRLRNDWVDAYNKRFFAHRRMIKDVRANLMLKWIKRHFPDMPIIFIMRHPCAVANSRMRVRFPWYVDPLMLGQPNLMADWLAPFERELRAISDPFDNHVFFWCIENFVPLRQFARGEIHIAFYESYCVDPRAELRRLTDFLGWRFEDRMLANIAKPSVQARRKHRSGRSAILTGESLLDNWRTSVDDSHIRRAVEILGLFGLDAIYSSESMPNVEAAYAMLGEHAASAAR